MLEGGRRREVRVSFFQDILVAAPQIPLPALGGQLWPLQIINTAGLEAGILGWSSMGWPSG